jgi:hypothetical protein
VTFFSIGLLYWWHLLSPIRGRLDPGGMGPVVYMLSTKLGVGLLGIALTFAPDALYKFYEQRPGIWGCRPTEDQAAAGAVMALEQSIIMGIALAYLFIRALEQSEREQQRIEALEDRAAAAAAQAEAETAGDAATTSPGAPCSSRARPADRAGRRPRALRPGRAPGAGRPRRGRARAPSRPARRRLGRRRRHGRRRGRRSGRGAAPTGRTDRRRDRQRGHRAALPSPC